MSDLLSPTNDYVFKRLFGESPDLLLHLINDIVMTCLVSPHWIF